MTTRTIASLIVAIGSSACTSVGVQYVSPTPGQPAATLRTASGAVFVNTLSEEGCYAGRTELPRGQDFQVVPGKTLIMAFQPRSDSWQCGLFFSFEPQQGRHYVVEANTNFPYRPSRISKENPPSCSAYLFQKSDSGALEPVPVKRLAMRQRRIACLEWVERPAR